MAKFKTTRARDRDGDFIDGEYIVFKDGQRVGSVHRTDNWIGTMWEASDGGKRIGRRFFTKKDAVDAVRERAQCS